jgi:hypothetical protein
VIQNGGKTLYSKIHNSLIITGIKKNFHSCGRNLLMYPFIKNGKKLTAVITEALLG